MNEAISETIRLDISENLNAEELDALIRRLALARAGMSPPVPSTNKTPEQEVLIEDMPALNIAARSGGGFRLWIRHRGLNWLGFQIDDQTAAGISRFIRRHIGEGPGIDLIGLDLGDGH